MHFQRPQTELKAFSKDIEVSYVYNDIVISRYEIDYLFGPIDRAIENV